MLRPLSITLISLIHGVPSGHAEEIRFNRDIRPILSEKCIACHGPDAKHREAGLRLDLAEGAYAKLAEGEGRAIVPGDPDASIAIKRILATDPDVVMPPPKSHKEITPGERDLLTEWIRQGAEYEPHWSYTPLLRPAVPTVETHADLVRNPIDSFILARLEKENVEPTPQASPAELRRRLWLDLTGLPPSPGSPENTEKIIDAALESPAFGERMAVPWLDVVRFADTVGYHGDQLQRVFPYRDYVIRSINENKPFDQFVREQLAGDLLPDATGEQHIASAFNRLNLVTREGGAQSREYFKKYAADRVRAVGAAFLGQTTGCAECHDHKYDPISQRDFYSLAAFFDDVRQWGVYNKYVGGTKYIGNGDPFTPERIVRSDSQFAVLARLQEQAVAVLDGHSLEHAGGFEVLASFAADHPDGWAPLSPTKAKGPAPELEAETIRFTDGPSEKSPTKIEFALDPGPIGSVRVEALPDPDSGNVGREENGHFTLKGSRFTLVTPDGKTTSLEIRWAQADLDREHQFAGGLDHGDRASLQLDEKHGWQSAPKPGYEGPDSLVRQTQTAVFCLKSPLDVAEGTRLRIEFSKNTASKLRVSQSPVLDPVPGQPAFTQAFHEALERRSPAAHHLCLTPPDQLPEIYLAILNRIRDCRSGWTRVVVTEHVEAPEFPTRVLPRGNWQDDSGDLVEPAAFSFLPSASLPKDRKLTRLDLANWIVADENPLTARHYINRLWKQFFGRGISNILDDLGGQGEPPTHPDLLDWLAVEFRESGWDVKHMVRLMVESNTYRQAAATRRDLLEKDPYNQLFARQTGRRLDAEFIRDQALAAAGLLNRDIVGGPSFRVYQPDDYYANLNYPVRRYQPHLDDRQHRRSLYAHWQRTFLLPTLANFDAPARDECAADRSQANIPQQALTLLNDPVYVEAARGLAIRVLEEKPDASDAERLDHLFQLLLARTPDTTERERILTFLKTQRENFASGRDQADPFLKTGIAESPSDLDPNELAAWSQTARLVLNLHETLTRY